MSLRNHVAGKRAAAQAAAPFKIITAVLGSVPVSVWLVAADDGDVLYANAYAMAGCGWRGLKRRPLHALSRVLSFGNTPTSVGIKLTDLHRMSRARKSASTQHGTLKSISGSARLVCLRATPQISAEHGMLLLVSAAAAPTPSPRNAPLRRWVLDVSHTLNNIGASLMGFVELASETNEGNIAFSPYIDEFRLVYSRLAQVAGSLELLAEARSPQKTLLLSNIPALQPQSAGSGYALRLECAPQLRVSVNAETLRQTLAGLAALPPSTGAGHVCRYTVDRTKVATTCSACDAAVASGAVRIQAKIAQAKGDVFLDAVMHGAHRAGGHVRWKKHSAKFEILIPVAN